MKVANRRRLLGLGTLLTILLLACPSSSQAMWLPYPGLPVPDVEPVGATWQWVQQTGMSETAKAKQWVAVPPLTLASYGGLVPGVSPPGGPRRYKASAVAAFVSPLGAPEPYGYMPPMRVRTVGFGLLPAEATIQISQRRRADGTVVPIDAELTTDYYDLPAEMEGVKPGALGKEVAHGTVIEDAFDVRVTQVTLDGVDIGLTGDCRTVRPAPVHMVGPGYTIPAGLTNDEGIDYMLALGEENYFNPVFGGQVSGTIEIPPFTGCTTRNGDDLSPMLTLSASGPGNQVVARARFCYQTRSPIGAPPAPGDWDKFPFPGPGQQERYAYCNPIDDPDELIPYPDSD